MPRKRKADLYEIVDGLQPGQVLLHTGEVREERRVVLERKHWHAGAGHFEFKNDELIVRAIYRCPEAVMEIEMSWPTATDLPF